MSNFLTENEIRELGLKSCGKDVRIGRHAVLYHPERLVFGDHVRIDDFTVISGVVEFGNYIHVSQFCGLYGGDDGIYMEDYSGLSSKCSIYAVSDDYSGHSMTNPMVPAKYKPHMISAPVKIKKHAIVGCNSVVLPGVVIEEGTAIGSMSLCTKSTEEWSVYTGIPARRKGERKRDLLELENNFMEDLRTECYIGKTVEVQRVFTSSDVEQFAQISGDRNALHLDEEYAQRSRFGRPIVHGMLVAGLISKIIGMQMPGKGSIYLEQNLSFKKPVYIGEKVTAKVCIRDIDENRHIFDLETNVYNEEQICVLAGSAKILYEG